MSTLPRASRPHQGGSHPSPDGIGLRLGGRRHRVHLGAGFHEKTDVAEMIGSGGGHERGGAEAALRIGLGAVPRRRRTLSVAEGQRAASISGVWPRAEASIGVGAPTEKQVDFGGIRGGPQEGRHTRVVGGIDRGPGVEQESQRFEVSEVSGQMQGRIPLFVAVLGGSRGLSVSPGEPFVNRRVGRIPGLRPNRQWARRGWWWRRDRPSPRVSAARVGRVAKRECAARRSTVVGWDCMDAFACLND